MSLRPLLALSSATKVDPRDLFLRRGGRLPTIFLAFLAAFTGFFRAIAMFAFLGMASRLVHEIPG